MSIQPQAHSLQQRSRFLFIPICLVFMLSIALFATMSFSAQAARASSAVLQAPAGLQFSPQIRIGFQAGDDWEPSITADRFGHIYTLYKHYDVAGTGPTCAHCNLHLLVQRSDDGGNTWSDPKAIAPVAVKGGQYDPQIMVDPVDGRTVWASFLQNSNSEVAVVKSTDFGKTWSPITIVSNLPPGLDKDELAVRGKTILVAYDDNRNTWASITSIAACGW